MPIKPPAHRPPGYQTADQAKADRDRNRASAAERGYDSRWRKVAAAFRAAHPLCVMCEAEGVFSPAFAVDHIRAHKGDPALMWDVSNFQSLCRTHHNRDKQRIEAAERKRPD